MASIGFHAYTFNPILFLSKMINLQYFSRLFRGAMETNLSSTTPTPTLCPPAMRMITKQVGGYLTLGQYCAIGTKKKIFSQKAWLKILFTVPKCDEIH